MLGIAALVGVYYGAAHLGYAFQFAGPVAAVVWLPVGVAIAFLYFGGVGLWPGVVIGDLLVNNYSALPLGTALATSCGNLLEAVVATLVLSRAGRRRSPLDTIRGLTIVLAALATGTAVSATIGTLASLAGELIGWDSFAFVWRTWWLGDFSGALIVVPFALAWSRPPRRPWPRARVAEVVLMLAVLLGISWIAFGMRTNHPLTYLAFPALVWAALRFHQRGATAATLLVSGAAVWSTTHNVGPFVFHSVTSSVLSAQLFIVVASVSALSVAALVSEREQLARRVRASRVRLMEAADAERRRLERNLHDGAQQRLVFVASQLGLAEDLLPKAPSELRDLVQDAGAQALLAIEDLRELAHGIDPAVLREFGFARAVAAVVARSGNPVELGPLPAGRFDPLAEGTAYYVVLEAIANATKYAPGAPVRITAEARPGWMDLEIQDDGPGGAAERPGSGLEGLRDRVEATGGTFTLTSEPGRGTRVAAAIRARAAR